MFSAAYILLWCAINDGTTIACDAASLASNPQLAILRGTIPKSLQAAVITHLIVEAAGGFVPPVVDVDSRITEAVEDRITEAGELRIVE